LSLESPWLSDWRAYADETELTPKSRRSVEAAIRTTSREWETRHAVRYRADSERRSSTRDEKVVGAAQELSFRLAEIRRDVRAGRLSPKEARAEVRSVRGRYLQAVNLHDTLIEREDFVRLLAAMSPDDYQRQTLDKFPVMKQAGNLSTLAGVVAQMEPPPAPGGSLTGVGTRPGDGARMIGCAAATGLHRCVQRSGSAVVVADERPRQGRRDPRPATVPGPAGLGGHQRSDPSGRWFCVWLRRTPAGDTGVSTANY
jgi:hypothetical protein